MRIEALAAFNGGAAKIAVLAVLLSLLFLTIRFWATRARRRVERRSEDGGPGARTPGPGPGQAGAPSAALLRTNQYRQFDERFRASLQLKDRASLGSACARRRRSWSGMFRHCTASGSTTR